jgi:hypothetical protein
MCMRQQGAPGTLLVLLARCAATAFGSSVDVAPDMRRHRVNTSLIHD